MSLPDVELRPYTHDDLDAIVTLDALCFDPLFRFGRSAMMQFAEAENAWTRLAFTQGRLAGFLIVHLESAPTGQVGYLVTIDVDRTLRSQGLGGQMLRSAESWLAASGAQLMLLHVYVRNYQAIAFYERNGYRRGDEQIGFYASGMDAVIYWKRLDCPAAG